MKHWTLVTGASEGIGKEFARIAAKEGRSLVITARSEDKLNALADELLSDQVQVVVIPADLSDLPQAEKMWAGAIDGRRIDVLVNNAGLGSNGAFKKLDNWDRERTTIDVNIMAASYLMKQAIPYMQDHGGGRILNVASVAGFMPGPQMAVYHASKAYLLSLSEAVSEELRGSNVTITALCPGATQSNFFNDADMTNANITKMGPLPTAKSVAELGWIAMRGGRRIIVTGVQNKFLVAMVRFLPRSWITRIAKKVLSKPDAD
ncbi:SDR family NAD(P)-dependent oxidoreductase [Pseudaestuariivita rosea]|uniref:SDR family NAD(P)-dependent oxidoreductase n=1 Tax=Pseudaestuariivita rosea TaxID=2763263 RepID=UPI001ABAA076|nr:SDR family oxidoreductase [Pseudaestuariivita rosea]